MTNSSFINKIKPTHIKILLALILVILASHASLLYWQGNLTLVDFIIWILGLVILGLMFISGVRIEHKDGFINGFRDGKVKARQAKENE